MDVFDFLTNPLASLDQLSIPGFQLDGIPPDLAMSVMHIGARLTQMAGILLELPQDIVAQALVVFARFWVGPDGGSLLEHSVKHVSAAALYLVAKPSAYPKSPRSVINVYAYLDTLGSVFCGQDDIQGKNVESCYVSQESLTKHRMQLMETESAILRVLGYDLHVALPYSLCVNYLQALDGFADAQVGSTLVKRAYGHLNSSLLNPQLLYLTHQPPALATAAIYLAAREVGVKLPGEEWWEVFDTDREELGFLVVAMLSMANFVQEEKAKWQDKPEPWTVNVLKAELSPMRQQE